MEITRRKFIGGGLALGGGLVLGSTGPILRGLGYTGKVQAAPTTEEKVVRTACNPECNHCGYMVHVRNGRAVRIKPDPKFYLRPCLRGYSRLQWTYHPDRLKYPFKRVGERGEGKWERISWDEALDLVAKNLDSIRSKYGPQSVLFYGGAVMSTLRFGYDFGLSKRFANAFGKGATTDLVGSLCCAAQGEGETAMVGYRCNVWDTLSDARMIINWGHNPAQSYHAHWYLIADALDAGARMVTIDPRFSDTAAKSDSWLAPLPSTDLALSMGMINIIIQESLYDKNYVLKKTNLPFLVNEATGKLLRAKEAGITPDNTDFVVWDPVKNGPASPSSVTEPALEGQFTINTIHVRTVFSRLKERAFQYSPQKVEEITGVAKEKVEELARDYATIKPATINSVMSGAQRTSSGEYFVASLVCLSALTGNLPLPGGGVNDLGGPLVHGTLNLGEFLLPYPPAPKGQIPMSQLGEMLDEGKPYPIKGVYWQGAGLGQYPNSGRLMKAMKKADFLVVADNFFTDAASIADVVLPAATLFEYTDLMASHVNEYYQLIDQAIEPLWESRSDPQIYRELAKRLGFGEYFDKTDEEWVDFVLKNTGLSVKTLRERGAVWAWGDERLNNFGIKREPGDFVFFRDTPIRTPSGRVEFHATRWEDKGFEPMVDYFPPKEGKEKTPELAQKYPLHLVNAKIRTKVHSSFALMPWLSEIYPKGWVELNPKDAENRGIQEGDKAEVLNDRGKLTLTARINPGVRSGVAVVQNGWWIQQGTNSSILTNDAPSAIANGHTLNSTLVEVRRAQ
ncbi:molybdopterin-dependent oxidoreductase [Desulfitobacterium sp. Sab5]|uniref:molybdopterin-containing oxidoreductase family protein n=1 Tax=Desulfitobacterium nosdiversum TaxID=3375356 RepID=UPI003CF9FABA